MLRIILEALPRLVSRVFNIQSCLFILYFAFVIFGCACLYNRFFHPLRAHPGPLLASLTDLYKLHALWATHIPTSQLSLHRKYGSIVRLAPNSLSISDPHMLPAIYHRYADKSSFYTHGVMGEKAPTFQTLNHKEHAIKRRIITPSLSMTNIRKSEPVVDQRILELCRALRQRYISNEKALDFADWARWYLQDTATHVTFGDPMGFVKNGCDMDGLIGSLHSQAVTAGLIASLPWLMDPIIKHPLLKDHLLPHQGDSTGAGKLMSYRDEKFDDLMTDPQPKHEHTLAKSLMQAQTADGEAVKVEDVKTEVLAILIATTDTTASFICAFVNHIIDHPYVSAMLVSEIDEFETKGKLSFPVASMDDTDAMPYFMACVNECLRVSPSTPVTLPRTVSREGLLLNDTFIPPGTEIGANPYVTNRDPGIFGLDADKFDPSRWSQDPERVRQMHKWIFTWGWGPRDCVGRHFARMVAQKFLLQLFRNFHIERLSQEAGRGKTNDRGLCIYADQWLVFTERAGTVTL